MSKYSLKNLLQESTKVEDIFDAYSNKLYGMIDPVGYSRDNFEDISSGNIHKYGSTDSAAVWLEDKENMKSLPVPIREGIEDVYESSWIQEVSFKKAKDEFFNEYPELDQMFYGIDDVDPQMVRDAGYEEEAAYWEQNLEDHKLSRIYTDFEVRFGTSIKTNFDGDPNSIYVYVYSQLYDYEDLLIEVDLGETYNNIDSPEALEAAITEFQTELVPKFMAGEKPSNITLNEAVDASKEPINEDMGDLSRYEGLLNSVASYPLHYVDLQDSLEQDMISDILDSGINQDTDAVITYVGKTVEEYLNKLDRKAGFIDKQGRPETDEGYFTMVGSDFYEELGISINVDEWDIYTSEGLLDAYTLTGDQVDDVIQAGELDKLSEQKDVIEAEQDDYDPSFTLIQLEIEYALEELMTISSIQNNGDQEVEELSSGDGTIRYADGGYKGYSFSDLSTALDYGTPTQESDEDLQKAYDELVEFYHEKAVKDIGKDEEHNEVWTDLSGDPDMITYEQLTDIADAIYEDDPERSKKYESAADAVSYLDEEYVRDDDGYLLMYEVEITHFTKDNRSNETGKPMLKFYADISSDSKVFAAKVIIKTFESEEELEKALEEGSIEIEKWFDGEENVGRRGIKEELNEGREDDIYELVKKETQKNITPGFNNPEEEFESSPYNEYSDVLVSEKFNIPFRDYLDGTLSLPKEFETNVIEELYIIFYKVAEQDVFSDIENYIPRSNEFIGIEDELGAMFISGDLKDIDPELYAEISNIVEEEADNYSLESGVGRSFNAFIDNDKKRIEFVASVSVDPLYKDIERKKEINLTFDQADKIPEVIQQMDDWLQGK